MCERLLQGRRPGAPPPSHSSTIALLVTFFGDGDDRQQLRLQPPSVRNRGAPPYLLSVPALQKQSGWSGLDHRLRRRKNSPKKAYERDHAIRTPYRICTSSPEQRASSMPFSCTPPEPLPTPAPTLNSVSPASAQGVDAEELVRSSARRKQPGR
ncbi:hypothetical protein B0H12DRAFT_1229810 [Mycena haematopus]|nr:hypothetical protein B0H12DRAFT_1229810 [Mycena haematopus]